MSGQRPALDQLHHQIRRTVVGGSGIERGHDVRMPRQGQRPRFAQQPFLAFGIRRVLRGQKLDRNGSSGVAVLGLEHRADAAAVDLPLQRVTAVDDVANVRIA